VFLAGCCLNEMYALKSTLCAHMFQREKRRDEEKTDAGVVFPLHLLPPTGHFTN